MLTVEQVQELFGREVHVRLVRLGQLVLALLIRV